MPTSTINSAIQHNTDAEFRAWAKQISDQLAAAGLTKTTDTGQIDFTTALRPTPGGFAGYEIWRFSDTLQGTRPIFIKVEYGTSGAGATFPDVRVTVTSSTDGAGGMTGTIYGQTVTCGRSVAPVTAATNSFAVYNAARGFFGFVGWVGSSNATPQTAMIAFLVGRTSDLDGAPNAEGVMFHFLNNTATYMRYWSSGTGLENTSNDTCMVPGDISNSLVGTDAQLFRHYACVPRVRLLPGVLTHINGEIARGSTISAVLFGTTASTVLGLGDGLSAYSVTGNGNHCLAMLFE